MNAESGQEPGQTDKSGTRVTETNKEIPIHGEVKAFIDLTADLVPDLTSPEKRLLRNIIHPRKDTVLVRGHHPPSNFPILLIDNQPVAVHHINFRMAVEIIRHVGQRTRKKEIVGVEIRHDLPGRMTETQVDSALLSSIPGRFPMFE